MATHYLIRWKNTDEEWPILEKLELDHAAGGQLDRLERGDVIWPVDIRDGKLYLIGKMVIGEFVTAEQAASRLDYEPYPGEYHVMAEEGTIEKYRRINIMPIAYDLRFDSPTGADRLTPNKDGEINVYQFRQMRRLAPASVHQIEAIWHDGGLNISDITTLIEVVEDDVAYSEGETVVRSRQERQRSQRLVQSAKRHFKERHGRLFCQVCGFDFEEVYGELGADFIEAHHIVPLSYDQTPRVSQIDDIVMLCANCHRMIHRNGLKSVSEISQIVDDNKKT
jgi:predicted HNH restriction endonuclease